MGDLDEMNRYLEDMKKRDIKPDINLYNIVLDCYSKAHDTERMMKIYDQIENDKNVRADECTFSTLMAHFGKKGDIEVMDSFFLEMLKRKIKTSQRIYNILLDSYGRAEDMRKMNATIAQMKADGFKPDKITMSIMKKYLGDVDEKELKELEAKEEKEKQKEQKANGKGKNAWENIEANNSVKDVANPAVRAIYEKINSRRAEIQKLMSKKKRV
jgi:pentatricopeptide repeat protein